MRTRSYPIYNSAGWVLGECVNCKRVNYVEPHGTTAKCSCSRAPVEHVNIPADKRNPWDEVTTVRGRVV